MKLDLVKYILLLVLFISSYLTAASKLMVLEPTGETNAICKTIDKMLREKLGSNPDILLVDYKETLRFIYESELKHYPQPTENLFKLVRENFTDSIYVICTSIQYIRFTMVRKMFIKAAVKVELKIHLNIYKSPGDTIVYSEDIISSVNKNRGFIFFSSPDNAIPLSAIEKERLIEELIESTINKIVSAVVPSVTGTITDSTQLKDSTKIGSDSTNEK